MKPEEYKKLLIEGCKRHIKGIEIEKYKIEVKDYVPNTDFHYLNGTMTKENYWFTAMITTKIQHYHFAIATDIMTLDRIAVFIEMESAANN